MYSARHNIKIHLNIDFDFMEMGDFILYSVYFVLCFSKNTHHSNSSHELHTDYNSHLFWYWWTGIPTLPLAKNDHIIKFAILTTHTDTFAMHVSHWWNKDTQHIHKWKKREKHTIQHTNMHTCWSSGVTPSLDQQCVELRGMWPISSNLRWDLLLRL